MSSISPAVVINVYCYSAMTSFGFEFDPKSLRELIYIFTATVVLLYSCINKNMVWHC